MQVRCPHCRNPIEIVESDELDDISCVSCGSHFSLLVDETVTFETDAKRRIAHFELVDRLGLGSFGSVYKAQDTKLHRAVAIKIPRKSQLSPEDADKFLREARAAAQLNHPNIVGVHEVGRDGDSVYIVSDYVQGADLKRWRDSRPLSIKEAAELCRKIALALHHAHEAGIVHRDLKPGNIMMDLDGEPHLTDFGLAKHEAAEITMTVDGQIIGTPAYMSPEQARGQGHQADRRSDVYSLGVILFQLLTGELPFRGEKQMLIVQILQDDPPSPIKLNQRVPRDLNTICLKALMKEPSKRYATAKDFADDLGRYLNHEPIHARPTGPMERAARWCRRRPAIAALTGALALSIVVGFSGVLWQLSNAVSAAKSERRAKQEAELNAQAAKEHELDARAALAREAETNERLVRQLYAVKVGNAGRSLIDGDIEDARSQLHYEGLPSSRGDVVGFEWYLLRQLCDVPQYALPGTEAATSISYSADGQLLATLDEGGEVLLWNAKDGRRGRELSRPVAPARCIEFSTQGKLLAIANESGAVELWDCEQGSRLHALNAGSLPVNDLAFDPTGELLATAAGNEGQGEGVVCVWNVESGGRVKELPHFRSAVGQVAYSPDGALLAGAESKHVIESKDLTSEIRVWDASSFERKATLTADNGRRARIAFHPTRPLLFCYGFNAGPTKKAEIVAWDCESEEPIQTIDLGLELPGAIAVHPNGDGVATSGTKTVRFWSLAEDLKPGRSVHAHSGLITKLAFSPDGQSLASASLEKSDPVKIWDVDPPSNPLVMQDHPGWVRTVAFSPGGAFLATGSQRRLPTGESKLIVYRAEDATTVAEVSLPKVDIERLAYSPDGSRIAAACDNGEIVVFRADSLEREFTLKSRGIAVTHVLFASGGKRLISADGAYRKLSDDGTYFDNYSRAGEIRIWHLPTRSLVKTIDDLEGAVTALAMSPNGKLGVTTNEGMVYLWNWQRGEMFRRKKVFPTAATAIAFHPHEPSVAVAGIGRDRARQGEVRILEPETLRERVAFVAHRNRLDALAYSPDGNTLASANFDGQLKFFDPQTGQQRLELPVRQATSLAFAPRGRALAIGRTSRSVAVLWYE